MQAFLSAFVLIFLAEMGDKTQFVAMALAARYDKRRVFLVLNVLAVFAGQILFRWIPPGWIRIAAGVLFLAFGALSLREFLSSDDDEKDEADELASAKSRRGPVLTAFLMIFLAEMGDKTQIATATMAAGSPDFLAVLLGSTLALWCVSLLGIGVGALLAAKISPRALKLAAAVLFLAFGASYLAGGFALLGLFSCPDVYILRALLSC